MVLELLMIDDGAGRGPGAFDMLVSVLLVLLVPLLDALTTTGVDLESADS